MTMETREKTFCLVAIVIGLVIGSSSLALMIGTPSPPWVIHLSQVISMSIILSGMVAVLLLICRAFVIGLFCTLKTCSEIYSLIGLCYDSEIRSALYSLIGFSLALVIGTSSLAWAFHISLVSTSIIVFGMEAVQIYLRNNVERSGGYTNFRIEYSKIDRYSFHFLRRGSFLDLIFPAESVCKIMSKITSSDKPKSSVYSENGRRGLGLRTSLFFFFLCFPELALASDLSKVSICISLFGMVALAEISLQVRVKKHGQGQSSNGQNRGSGAGNAGGSVGGGGGGGGGGDENGTTGHGTGQGSMSVGGQGQGNDDDDDNDGGRVFGNLENGGGPRNPTPEEIATIYLPIIIQSVANIMSLNVAELSTTGRVIRYLSMIINSVGFICCAAVLWRPYTNRRVASVFNPGITGFLSRIGSALAVLGFISMMGVGLPLYPSLIMGLAFLLLLVMFLMDISEAIQ